MYLRQRILSNVARERLQRGFTLLVVLSFVFQTSLGFAPLRAFAQAPDDTAPLESSAVLPLITANDTGWRDPASNTVLNATVTDPVNAYAEDDADAVIDPTGLVQFGIFNVNVPAGRVVTGIEVQVRGHRTEGIGTKSLKVALSDDGGATWTSEKITTGFGSSYETDSVGGNGDLWGHGAWTAGQLTDGNFAVRLAHHFSAGMLGIDHVAVKVFYADAPLPNPVLTQSCGLDVGLVIDSSGSINPTELGQMQTAFKGFVDAFLPGTPTRLSVVEFDTDVEGLSLPFTDNVTILKMRIDAAESGGFTNWEAGLFAAHSLYDPRPAKADLILFASDGNPNTVGTDGDASSGAAGESLAVAAAITQANAIKSDGIRVVTLGIGNDLNVENLKAISGTNVNTGATSDVITSDFSTLAEDLAEFADGLCGGKILVQKQFDLNADGVADLDGSVASPSLGDWTFAVNGEPSQPDNQTTTSTGSLEFDVLSGTYAVTETSVKPGTAIVGATCQKGGAAVGTFDPVTRTVSGLSLTTDETISCTFLNQAIRGTLRVVKLVSGGSAQPANWQIHVRSGESDVIGSPQTGTSVGTDYLLPPGTYQVTESGGPAGYALAYSGACNSQGTVTIAFAQAQTCTLTNTAVAPTLALQKSALPNPVAAGQNVTYTMSWSVGGTAAATNVVISDPIPTNTSFVSVQDGGSYDAATRVVTWTLGTQSPGASGQVHFVVLAANPIANGTVLANTASIDSTETDPVTASANVTVTSAPSLSITKSSNATTSLNPGQSVTYTMVVTNAASATDTALGVVVTDTLPTGLTFDDGTTVKTFTVGELAPGASKTVTASTKVASSAAAGTYTNTAKAKGSNTPEVSATANVSVVVPQVLAATANPKLAITKTVKEDFVNPGGKANYTVTVKNEGDATAVNVRITDSLPTGFTFTETGLANRVWVVGDLDAKAVKTITYEVTVDPATKTGTYENLAVAMADNHDPVSAQATIEVRKPSVLSSVTELPNTGAGTSDKALYGLGVFFLMIGALGLRLNRREPDLF